MSAIKHVLVIEDDILFRQAIQLLLEEIGKEVILAETGRKGLQAANSPSVDLIFCDFRLGDVQGDDVIHQLKSNPITSRIPVVLMTGNRGAIDECGLDADYHLAKPFQVRELIELIRHIESAVEPTRGP